VNGRHWPGSATQAIGDPLDPTRNFGPMATKVHYERVMHSIEQATANQDGELLTGGGAADREGFFVGRGSLGSNQQAANLVRTMIIRYRIRWLSGDSPGASSHTIVGVHGKRRSEMRVHGVYEPPGLIDRRSGGIDVRKQLRRPILQGA
jgi:hypothetical protein